MKKIMFAVLATAGILAGCTAPTTTTEQPPPVTVTAPAPTETLSMQAQMEAWSGPAQDHVEDAAAHLNKVARKAGNYDLDGMTEELVATSVDLYAVEESPDGGATSDLIHKAAKAYEKAGTKCAAGNLSGCLTQIQAGTGWAELATDEISKYN